jgi:UrcA family protein
MNIFNATRSAPHWLAILAAFACVGISNQDYAVAAESDTRVKVGYADLDLGSPAGAAVLYGRIKLAARKVCSPTPDPRELHRYGIWNNCYQTAISNAVATVASPRLTALHGKSKSSENLTAALVRNPRGR